MEARAQATFDGQAYDVPSPYGSPVVLRRRTTYTLGLDVAPEPEVRHRGEGELYFRGRMRLDGDFGPLGTERDPESNRYVPGLEPFAFDVMYAYVEGTGYFDGYLGFRLGRQLTIDSLGFWSFDGALLSLSTTAHLKLMGYVGYEERGGLSMATTRRFEQDGVQRGDRGDLPDSVYPEYLAETELAPAWGVSVETLDLGIVRGRIDYRKVTNTSPAVTNPFDATGDSEVVTQSRTSSERVGGALHVDAPETASLSARLVYDLFVQLPSEYFVAADAYLGESSSVGLSYDYFLPTFDGDSIFNWFSHQGSSRALVRGKTELSRHLSVSGWGGARFFFAEDDWARDVSSSGPSGLDGVLGAEMRHAWQDTELRVSSTNEVGNSGRRLGGDAALFRIFGAGASDALLRVSLYDFADALRPERDATSFTYVVGGGVSPQGLSVLRARLGAEWEHSMNRLVGHRYRVLLTGGVTWTL